VLGRLTLNCGPPNDKMRSLVSGQPSMPN
jgi:hypothetical protein